VHYSWKSILKTCISQSVSESVFQSVPRFSHTLPSLSWALYLCSFLCDSLLTTKRHRSDVNSGYVPIFNLFLQLYGNLYAWHKFDFVLRGKLLITLEIFIRFAQKLMLRFALGPPISVIHFSRFRVRIWELQPFLSIVWKERIFSKVCSYLGNGWRNFCNLECASPPPSQIWCHSD